MPLACQGGVEEVVVLLADEVSFMKNSSVSAQAGRMVAHKEAEMVRAARGGRRAVWSRVKRVGKG